jgi:uncharacterized repeat protein (TIGR01451 family)
MKRLSAIGLGVVALLLAAPVISAPVQSHWRTATAPQQPVVQLQLVAEAQTITQDAGGKAVTTWTPTGSTQPGAILRYTLRGQNLGDRPVGNLVLTQPIPAETVYLLESAQSPERGSVTYSIDGGKTFVAAPQVPITRADGAIEYQPASAEAYTHVRWQVANTNAGAIATASYQVRVR